MNTKAKLSRRIPLFILALTLFVLAFTVIMTSVSAADEIEVVGAMSAIKGSFDEKYLTQATVRADDKYVGKIQYTVYYDKSLGAIKTGYEGTPIILYSINHPSIERIGTDSDVTIIQSMLDRGYVVIVVDYLNNENLTSRDIASSTQVIRQSLRGGIGNILTNRTYFPSGIYPENYLAPAGYNVNLFNVFWEIDKHSAEGTLEKIVENWNSDFRATKGGNLLKWATGTTVDTRKQVQNDLDGNAPKWYDANGKEDANGLYTYIKFTKAETVTDCVDPDGSFLDMNLYIHIVYPTSPENEVPVMSLANSTGYPTTTVGTDSAYLRQHSNGFLYNGYANVVFDYMWQPMARSASWGYYDGSGGNTKDHMNYGLMMYNDKLVNTAAMRYIRYISLSGGDTYNFDLDKFGVYGNSKGGWFSFLGEKVLQSELVDASQYTTTEALEEAINTVISSFIPDRYYKGHHGETRYQMGKTTYTKNGFTVNGGEKQPWLTYGGKEILSGCQLTNACNGSQEEDITAGHSPIFISGNMTDDYNAAYSYSVNIYNICRELNIPLLHFEVPIGHTLTEGQDMNYNVDTYEAFFKYVNYYLKSTPISVSHVSPMNNAGNVKVTDKITVYFAGAVTETEIAKITVTGPNSSVQGKWESSFGGTTWTFTPDALEGSTLYTVTVPADLKGDNGASMGTAYTASFLTELDNAKATVINGDYHSIKVPAFTTGNSFVFRFLVDNDAVNVAELYAVSAVGETTGEYLGSVKVNGTGSYEIDITDFAAENAGNDVVLYLKTAKTAGNHNVFTNDNGEEYDPFDTHSKSNSSTTTYTTGATTPDGETAFKVVIANPSTPKDNATGLYPNISYYYSNVTSVFTFGKIVGNTTTAQNEGKRFIISFDVYDTVNRVLEFRLKTMTNRTGYGTIDYDNIMFNVYTKANDWTHVEFTYDVYEPKYGFASENASNPDVRVQFGEFLISPSGDTAMPVYFNNLKSVEVLTELDVKSAAIAEKNDGTGMPYTPAVSSSPFALYNGSEKIGDYAGWKAALAAYKAGYTLTLQSDYTFTDSDITNALGNFDTVNVDLGGYTITSANTKNSLLYAYAANTAKTVVNVSGGAILLNRTPLVSYEGSTSAGSGKTFNINLTDTYIGFVDNAFTTEIISARTTASGITVNSNISLNGCTVDLPDYNHANDEFTVFPAPTTTTLKIKYNVTGGEFKLTSERWVSVSENANIVEFFTDNSGAYTKLIFPASFTYDVSGSYLNEEGYAVYKRASVTDNMATYTLEVSDNSTRYGVIPDTYMNASQYPFVVFKDGNLIGGYSGYKAAMTAAASALTGAANADKEAHVLMRANQATTEEVNLGASAGTIVVDLGGFTLLRDKTAASMVVNSNTVFDYATGVLFKNGRIEMSTVAKEDGSYSTGLFGATHVLAHSDKVKTFNVTFEAITFGFADGYYANHNANGLLWAVWQNRNKGYTSTETITNLTLNDCVFDFTKNAPLGKNLISASETLADFNIAINGGEIKGDASAFSLVVKDDGDTFVLGKNSKSEYLKLADGAKPVTDNFYCDDGVYRYFAATENGYELVKNPLSTNYGVISAKYEDAQKYPFALFTNGTFKGAYTHWANTDDSDATEDNYDVVQRAKDEVMGASGAGKVTTIYLRRDYALDSTEYSVKDGTLEAESFNNYSQIGGTVVIDLGGHTLTLGSKTFMPSTAKATSKVIHNTKFEFINGKIELKSSQLINYGSSSTLTSSKNFDYTFKDIKFILSAISGNSLIGCGTFDGTATLNANVEFTNCTFDYSQVPADSITLFNISNAELAAKVTVKGGKIISNSDALAKIKIASLGNNGSVVFDKYDGKYITMTTPTTAAYKNVHYTGTFNTPEGTMYFVEMTDDGTTSTYELGKMTFEYGTISVSSSNSKFLSAVDFPFVTFANGAFKAGYGSFKDVMQGTNSSGNPTGILSYGLGANDTVYVVQRRDFTNTHSGINANEAKFKVVIDLNGFTLANSANYLIDIHLDYAKTALLGYKSSIEFKNGTLLNERPGKTMFALGHVGTNANYDIKEYSFTFTNVTFKVSDGGTKFIEEWGADATNNKHNGDGLKVDYVFDGCTFDFTGAANGALIVKAKNTYNKPSIIIKGGSIIADNFANYSLYDVNADATAYLAKDENGKYLTLTELSTSAAPTATYKSSTGTVLSFGKDSVNGNYTVYLIGEPISTKYGDIPFMYQSVEDYPFVYFDENGNFKYASAYLYGANASDSVLNKAKEYLKANTWNGTTYGDNVVAAFILMRRDYTMASNETFNNLSQVQGVLTIDLGGYTLTANDSNSMFPSCIKPWSGSGDKPVFKTQFDVINGTIKLSSKSLISFSAWNANGNDVSVKQFVYNFTDVKFVAKSSASSLFANYSQHEETPEAIGNPELIFNNCTFDLTNAKSGAVLFNLGNGYVHTNVTVNGGEIIANNTNFVMFTKNEATTSNLVFGKDENGKCVYLTLPAGVEAPRDVYVVDGLDCIFVKASAKDGNVSYTLRPEAIANYKIQTSVTLWSNFIYNIYIPTASVKEFTVTFNGKSINEYKTETIGSVEYYCVSVNLPAGEALSDIKAYVTLEAGETEINMTWTLNVLKYVKAILAGNYSDVTKTLMKDMLAYASAAHTYFENTEAIADKLSEVAAILKDYSVAVPTGEAKTPAENNPYFTDVAIYLGEVPSFRFYLASGYTKDSFAFTVGGRSVEATLGNDNDGKGDYLEITMYAYMMLDDVSYTVNGTEVTESYNIYSYYEFAKTQNNTNLVAIVEALMKYSASANAYRNAVIEA